MVPAPQSLPSGFDSLFARSSRGFVRLVQGLPQSDPYFARVLLLALISTLLRGLLAHRLELFQDEALYWYIGVHAPLTFSPHPPGTPLLAWLGTWLLGRTELGVRIGNVLLGGLVLPAFYLLGRRLVWPHLAFWTTVAFACTPIYFGFGTICTPDMPQLFFWVLLLSSTARALEGREKAWLSVGALLGLGLYFKYILILYVPALALYLRWSGAWRRAADSRYFLIGAAIAGSLFFPVALWREASTGWSALEYHLRDRQEWSLSIAANVATYLGAHLLYYSPFVCVAMLVGLFEALRQGGRARDWRLLFLGCFGAVPWLFFFLIAAVTRRELSREQWDAPAYVCGLLAAAWWLHQVYARLAGKIGEPSPGWQRKIDRLRRRFRGLVTVALGLSALLLVGVIAEQLWALPSRLLGRSPFFSTMIGWRTLAQRVDELLREAPHSDQETVLVGSSFIPALQLAFYSKTNAPIFAFNGKANARYGLTTLIGQVGISEKDLRRRTGVDAIYVNDPDLDDNVARTIKRHRERLLHYFEVVEELPPLEIYKAGHLADRFILFRCRRLYASAEAKP